MVIFGVFSYVFLFNGFNTKTKVRVNYDYDSETFYEVNFVDSEYSSLYSDKYLSDMVDTIVFNYNYNNVFSEYISGYYKYNVEGYLVAYEDDITESLWERSYRIVDDKNVVIDENKVNNIKISDSFEIDFQKYRDEVNNFIDDYDIDISAYLEIRVNILEFLNFNNMKNEYADSKVITINVPLTDNVFKIKISDFNKNDDENISSYYEFSEYKTMNILFIIIGAFCLACTISSLIVVVKQVLYIYQRESKYKKLLRKILLKYDESIVRVKRIYNSKKYNIIYVDSFDELMDVHNKNNKIINFKEVKRDYESIFVIFDGEDAWVYRLIVDDIK